MLTTKSLWGGVQWAACAGVLALAGCSAPASGTPPAAADTRPQIPPPSTAELSPPSRLPPQTDTCDATPALSKVQGKYSSPQIELQAARLAGATMVRTLRENQPVTREYAFGRLNLIVNGQGVILKAYCG